MATNRGYVYQSGDKDRIIDYLERCEKRMLEQFAEILTHANKLKVGVMKDDYSRRNYMDDIEAIIDLCNAYLDKRSDKQRMQDEIDELNEQVKKLTEEMEPKGFGPKFQAMFDPDYEEGGE